MNTMPDWLEAPPSNIKFIVHTNAIDTIFYEAMRIKRIVMLETLRQVYSTLMNAPRSAAQGAPASSSSSCASSSSSAAPTKDQS